MKAAPFDYVRPATVEAACARLAADADAVIIAGGQTLVPMMAMRLARPSCLVDIARLAELQGIRDDGDAIVIGAATRQVTAAESATVAAKAPLLAAALPFVGHAATRTRGTVGGSVANADPAAEIALVLTTLRGSIMLREPAGSRRVAADAFFVGPMVTAATQGSCVTAIHFPVWQTGRIGVGFEEISARRSDFALVAAAAQVALDASGRCTACALGIGGACAVPCRVDSAGEALVGSVMSDKEIIDAARAGADALDIMSSPHASDAYRRRAAATLGARALTRARDQAARHGLPA
ncbi:MAG TPA: FAD binding domain-containing protein [Xanthobacteraceae bacterium]|nr:FAD binding domain-containing protein [Xanthobacteraceae bacterium]